MTQPEEAKQPAVEGNAKVESDDDDIERAQIGYQAAISLWIHEGGLIWSKFNALLVANSIILASIGLTLSASNSTAALAEIFLKGMPIAGVVLCILWMSLTRRSFEAHDYWVLSARELEERHLRPTVKTVSRGGDFADGKQIDIHVDGQTKQLQKWPARQLPVEWVSYFTIGLFLVLYLFIGWNAW